RRVKRRVPICACDTQFIWNIFFWHANSSAAGVSRGFAAIVTAVGQGSRTVYAGLLEKRELVCGVRDGFGRALSARRTIAGRPTSRGGHRQYLQLGPRGTGRRC